MPKYRMTYPYARLFPTLGLVVEPDEVIEQDENPDGNFFDEVPEPKAEAPKATKSKSEED